MKKIAIFLEGKCELLFVEALIKTIANINHVRIEKIESSGSMGKRNFKVIEAKSTDNENIKYYILLYDCGGDKQVKSDIRDQYDSLKKAGHTKIIGIRDVYPDATFNELPQLRAGLIHGLNQQDLPSVIFCLGVMEFEAWLLAEHTHFSRFNSDITHEKILSELSINISECEYSEIPQPSKVLSDIYWLEKIPYDKNHVTMGEIFSAIDFNRLRTTVCEKFEDLKTLYSALMEFFELN
jgi:hypothetical protein